jgi:hypothetical protein
MGDGWGWGGEGDVDDNVYEGGQEGGYNQTR